MHAIHSTWTKPRLVNGAFGMDDFEILSTILSALKWREKNGTITMVTDSTGFEFYKSRNMLGLWDEVRTDLDSIPDTIDANMFWASGKLFALKSAKTPVAMLDTDFIVWDRLAFDNLGDLTAIHSEELYSDVYPDIYHFEMRRGYVFNPDFDWRIKPLNTAFYVLKNENLRNLYVSEAEKIMEYTDKGDNLTYRVFAEQRLLPMCANMLGIQTKEFSTLEKLFCDGERYFTHIWGMKQQLREDASLRLDFCMRCIRRIKDDFSEFVPVIENIKELRLYF